MINQVYCYDSRKCFARSTNGICRILREAYEQDGKCPFCKEQITDNEARKRRKQRKRLSVNTELKSCVSEIEAEYQKALNNPYIKKPLSTALYTVWAKHQGGDEKKDGISEGTETGTGSE